MKNEKPLNAKYKAFENWVEMSSHLPNYIFDEWQNELAIFAKVGTLCAIIRVHAKCIFSLKVFLHINVLIFEPKNIFFLIQTKTNSLRGCS
jgi:hypothetical protein